MLNCLLVGLGGFVGSICRYLIGLLPINTGNTFPYKTLIINIVGSFLIGLIVALSLKYSQLNPKLVLLLKVGFCGGFTTFSTFAFETSALIQKGQMISALVYILISICVGTAAIFLAEFLVK